MEVRFLSDKEIGEAAEALETQLKQDEDTSWQAGAREQIVTYLKNHAEKYKWLAYGSYEGILVFEEAVRKIVLLYVIKDRRRGQTGTELLDFLMQYAETEHLPVIYADADPQLVTFYQKYGFDQEGEEKDAGTLKLVPMEYLIGRKSLGKVVTVTVDHPYGSFHPHLPDVLYPVNYGYASDPISLDGEFQNAWVIGPLEPVETFKGVVSGIVYHKEDGTSRWIVTPLGQNVDYQKIIDLIGFEEQYYDTRILWVK